MHLIPKPEHSMTTRIIAGEPVPEDVRVQHAAPLVYWNDMTFFKAINKLKVRYNPLKRAIKALESTYER